MNKKKWRKKFEHKDSGRYLKRHPPHYSYRYHENAMPPPGKWLGPARSIMEGCPKKQRLMRSLRSRPKLKGSAEANALWLADHPAQRDIDAVAAAMREMYTQYPRRGDRVNRLEALLYWEGVDMETARRIVNVSRETAEHWDFIFLRSVAWHAGIRYNHTGRNRYGHSIRTNELAHRKKGKADESRKAGGNAAGCQNARRCHTNGLKR